MIGCLKAPEAAKSDGDAEEVANLRQALDGKRDKHPSVGKVDMGEIFLGTTWGMLLKIIFSVSPCVLLVNFTLGELFFFFRCLGRVFWMFVSA